MVAKAVGRWVADWRNGATIIAGVLVALLVVVTADGISGRREADRALKAQAEQALSAQRAATRRIDLLNGQISDLTDVATTNGRTIGELVGDVHALEAQVRALGAQPVVVLTTTTTSRPAPATTIRPAAAPPAASTTTTTTTRPAPTATTVAPTATTTTTTSKHCVLPTINPSCKQ